MRRLSRAKLGRESLVDLLIALKQKAGVVDPALFFFTRLRKIWELLFGA
jgi:hypothetical protein